MKALYITMFSLLIGFLTVDGLIELSLVFPDNIGFVIGSSGILALYWVYELVDALIVQVKKIRRIIMMPIIWIFILAQFSHKISSFVDLVPVIISILLAFMGEHLIKKSKKFIDKLTQNAK